MKRQMTMSDDRYQKMAEMATVQSPTPDEVLAALIDAAWERACAAYNPAFAHDPDWQASAQEAAAQRESEQARHAGAGDQLPTDAR